MRQYSQRFSSILKRDLIKEAAEEQQAQQLQQDPAANTPPEDVQADDQAMQGTLDQGSDVSDFDVQNIDNLSNTIKSQKEIEMVNVLHSWIDQIDKFVALLNGTDKNSIQSVLANAVPETLFAKMKVAENKRLARVASELSSLSEIMKGYIANAGDPKNRFV